MTIAIAGSGGGGGGPPTGPAGGDLTGTYPNPTLLAIGSASGPIGDGTHVAQVTIDAKGRVTGLASVLITGGGAPSGPAGGDLAGTYPNPTLAAIGSATGPIGDATHVSQVTIDTKGRVTALASVAIPTSLPPNGAAGGDLGGTYPNPTLAAIGSAIGPIGDGTHVSTVTIDTKGRVTALTSTLITGAPPNGAAGGDLAGTYPNPTLAAIGSAAGPIGDATHVSQVTIDAKGRVTALASVAITGAPLTVTSGNLGSDVVLVASTLTTLFTTISLAIGTWLLEYHAGILTAAAFNNTEIEAVVGTATATFAGKQSGGIKGDSAALYGDATVVCFVTVTVAGTLLLRCESTGTDTVKATTPGFTFPKATGYTLTKVA